MPVASAHIHDFSQQACLYHIIYSQILPHEKRVLQRIDSAAGARGTCYQGPVFVYVKPSLDFQSHIGPAFHAVKRMPHVAMPGRSHEHQLRFLFGQHPPIVLFPPLITRDTRHGVFLHSRIRKRHDTETSYVLQQSVQLPSSISQANKCCLYHNPSIVSIPYGQKIVQR